MIVDAAFLKAEQRRYLHEAALNFNATFYILRFQASEKELYRRIERRHRQGNDPSEATARVLQQQMLSADPLTAEELKMAVTVDTENENALSGLLKAFDGYSKK